jgi:hypothetical protein
LFSQEQRKESEEAKILLACRQQVQAMLAQIDFTSGNKVEE